MVLLLSESSHTHPDQAAQSSLSSHPHTPNLKPQHPKMPPSSPQPSALFQARRQSLQLRVNEAAKTLRDQGISPTVARIRTALGGGSPNDLTPALRHWKDSILPTLAASGSRDPSARRLADAQHSPLPRQVADLAQELWQRSLTTAALELKGGPTAREIASRTAEAQALRDQLTSVRDQLQRESLAYGELRAQAARHEAIARDALVRAQNSEDRERSLHRELGGLRQRVSELEATLEQAGNRRTRHSRMRSTKGGASPKASKAPKAKAPPRRSTTSRTPLNRKVRRRAGN